MTNKNNIAQFMDKIAEGISKAKQNSSQDKNLNVDDSLNILPKPTSQHIGDGIIVWRWEMLNGSVVVESILGIKEKNQQKIGKDEYIVSLKMPSSENGTYSFYDDTSKVIGQSILSAWHWKEIWKIHAADLLLAEINDEADSDVEEEPKKEELILETIEVDPEAVKTTPTFNYE